MRFNTDARNDVVGDQSRRDGAIVDSHNGNRDVLKTSRKRMTGSEPLGDAGSGGSAVNEGIGRNGFAIRESQVNRN